MFRCFIDMETGDFLILRTELESNEMSFLNKVSNRYILLLTDDKTEYTKLKLKRDRI